MPEVFNYQPVINSIWHFVFQISFFENVAAMTLQYLDSLVQRDEMAKSQFFRGLYKVMSKLPKVKDFTTRDVKVKWITYTCTLRSS